MNSYVVKAILRRVARAALLLTLLMLPALFGASWAFAQSTVDASEDELEEIIVVAPRTLTSMRAEIVRAEQQAVSLYNTLNENDDYDIRCVDETPLGSHIPERVCRPEYVIRMEARAAQDFIDFGIGMAPVEDEARHEQIMMENLTELSSTNPELLDALQKYYDAKTTYDLAREERFGSN